MLKFCLILCFSATAIAANSTCGVAPTLEVSKSALQGLTLHQLQFFNSSCNVADFANETANSYIISVNPNLCGAVVENGVFNQTLSQRFSVDQSLPNVNFTITCLLFTDSSPCNINNGNCSNVCIWSSGLPHNCYCPCGFELETRGYQCVTIFPCDIDFYVGIDIGRGSDTQFTCDFFHNYRPNLNLSIPFMNYLSLPLNFLENFVTLSSSSQWNIAIQTFTSLTSYTNVLFFEDPDLATGISTVRSLTIPGCFAVDYSRYLAFIVQNNSYVLGFQSRLPGHLRDPSNTTAIALFFTTGFYTGFDLTSARNFIMEPRNRYDAIVTVALNRNPDNIPRDRLWACGNESITCPRNFDFTPGNFTLSNFHSVVDLNACNQRRTLPALPTAVVMCSPQITVFIPLCVLLGVKMHQLQFNDPSCSVTAFLIEKNSTGILLSISSFLCDIEDMIVGNNLILHQHILTRNDTGVVLPQISIEINCSYPLPARPQSLMPLNESLAGISFDSIDDVQFFAFFDSNLTLPIQHAAFVAVNSPVYFKIRTALPAPFSIALSSCHATTTTNPFSTPRYDLASAGCPVDTTFTMQATAANTSLCFIFSMFEWGLTVRALDANKLPVYIHCNIIACGPGAECARPTCSFRRRRSVGDESDGVTTTFGPLFVSQRNKENEFDKIKQEYVDETSRKKNMKKFTQEESLVFLEEPVTLLEENNFVYHCVMFVLVAVLMACLIKKILIILEESRKIKTALRDIPRERRNQFQNDKEI